MTPFARDLLAWYDAHARDLPWRGPSVPAYHTWLSEIMLQQTRVKTALPYFHRFLERFPRVEDLASAPLDDVLAMWSGLGYYSRARNLHRAAQLVTERGGAFPDSIAGLKALPGVGDYVSAAVGSIAFGRFEPRPERLGQRDRGVVAGRQQQTVQQFRDGKRLARTYARARSRRLVRPLREDDHLFENARVFRALLDHHQRRHHLGGAREIARLGLLRSP